jgi:hypothetical protein
MSAATFALLHVTLGTVLESATAIPGIDSVVLATKRVSGYPRGGHCIGGQPKVEYDT